MSLASSFPRFAGRLFPLGESHLRLASVLKTAQPLQQANGFSFDHLNHRNEARLLSTSALKMSAMPAGMSKAPLCDAAFIFNFFLRPVMPDLQSGLEYWAAGGNRIQEYHKDDGKFVSTHLHMALSKDSHFEVFNFGLFSDFSALPFLIVKDPTAFLKIVGGEGPPPTLFFPGGFKEICGIARNPDKPSFPKWRQTGSPFVVATFAFEVDLPKGPPTPGSPPGPPGTRPANSPAISAARSEFETDWIEISGAGLLSRRDAVDNVYLYRRETHGVATYVLRAEISGGNDAAAAAAAKEAAEELKKFLAESEFLRGKEIRANVEAYEIIVNGDGKKLEPNRFGVA